ncbi:hypothetical protein [Bradyrhizobium sp. CCBAU 53415]|uniref:hypothetical protein n=1 Tax=Bradyrhizobium sp. CCBAU 53415 TaxID=1325119 RepID=UPI002304F7E1|nr:hypothetical protein [Bradyrhizobium sp. CCBAU 53415]
MTPNLIALWTLGTAGSERTVSVAAARDGLSLRSRTEALHRDRQLRQRPDFVANRPIIFHDHDRPLVHDDDPSINASAATRRRAAVTRRYKSRFARNIAAKRRGKSVPMRRGRTVAGALFRGRN